MKGFCHIGSAAQVPSPDTTFTAPCFLTFTPARSNVSVGATLWYKILTFLYGRSLSGLSRMGSAQSVLGLCCSWVCGGSDVTEVPGCAAGFQLRHES